MCYVIKNLLSLKYSQENDLIPDPTLTKTAMRIAEIFVYPVKSLKGIKVNESRIEQYGFEYDRVYMLATRTQDPESMNFLTQRTEPKLVKVKQTIENGKIVMSHEAVDFKLELPADHTQLPKDLKVVNVDVWGENVVSYNVGPIVPRFEEFWLKALGPKYNNVTILAPKKSRDLGVHFTPELVKSVEWTPETSFQDGAPGNLVCTASLETLQLRINTQNEGITVSAENFRPNMVVETDEPFEEDDWDKIKIGGELWHVPLLCRRCQMPTVNIETGEFQKCKQPTRALNQFRKVDAKHPSDPCFGMELCPTRLGQVIRVGDEVEVVSKIDRPMPGDF